MKYTSQQDFAHGDAPKTGILLANLGTPDEPKSGPLRRYLAEFLSDPRIIEKPRWQWLPILHGIVLRTRPRRSAKLYKEIWQEEGSPLLVISKSQRAKLESMLREKLASPVEVSLGMRYGNPSMKSALEELRDKGAKKIIVLPLYPQYSATSTGSVFDSVFSELKNWRWIPDLRTIGSYHDHPGFIECLARSVEEGWKHHPQPEKLILSYHGIPTRYHLGGDPYHCQCHKTTRLLARRLGLAEDRYMTTFQSLFGREDWLKPPTDGTLEKLAKSGVKSVDVICPGFSTDCLETLEEIEGENREVFTEAGGEVFNYIPALNDSEPFMDFISDLVIANSAGWVKRPGEWNHFEQKSELEVSRQEYQKLLKDRKALEANN